ncbi:MAG: SAM-dependent methyltransferase, partial [Candidatus Eremiobacterota bacterium]
RAAWAGIRARLESDYGVTLGELGELGGRYHPSPGTTPEVVFPLVGEVLSERPAGMALTWIPLSGLMDHLDEVRDGHLRILAGRAAMAISS